MQFVEGFTSVEEETKEVNSAYASFDRKISMGVLLCINVSLHEYML